MTEDDIRRIVREEMAANYKSGSPDIPPHSHNGTDGLNVDPVDLVGWTSIPASGKQYLNEDTGVYEIGFGANLSPGSASHAAQFIVDPTIGIYPISIVQGNGAGTQSAFNGGYAPDGTLVFFANGSILNGLYIRANGKWYGVNLPLTA